MSDQTIQTVVPGKMVPDFSAPATNGVFSLSEHRGKALVLYFYPRNNTPVCTKQSLLFRDHFEEFEKIGATVAGVSRDSIKSHELFARKFDLPFTLLSDTDEHICNLFNVLKIKKNYGRIVHGIERSTFLIDPSGRLVKEWRGIKVDGHIDELLDAIRNISA